MDKRRQNGKLIEPSTRAQSSEFDSIILLWSYFFCTEEIVYGREVFITNIFPAYNSLVKLWLDRKTGSREKKEGLPTCKPLTFNKTWYNLFLCLIDGLFLFI